VLLVGGSRDRHPLSALLERTEHRVVFAADAADAIGIL
jgi:hypothetical protein